MANEITFDKLPQAVSYLTESPFAAYHHGELRFIHFQVLIKICCQFFIVVHTSLFLFNLLLGYFQPYHLCVHAILRHKSWVNCNSYSSPPFFSVWLIQNSYFWPIIFRDRLQHR